MDSMLSGKDFLIFLKKYCLQVLLLLSSFSLVLSCAVFISIMGRM